MVICGNSILLTKVRIPLECVFHARVLFHVFHTAFATAEGQSTRIGRPTLDASALTARRSRSKEKHFIDR